MASLSASSGTLTPLPDDLHRGLTAAAVLAGISLVSSSSLVLYLTYRLIRWWISTWQQDRADREAEAATRSVDLSLGLAQRHFGLPEDGQFRRPACRRRNPPNQFLLLVYNLFLADTLQAVAFFINAVWVAQDGIFVHTPACYLQGWLVSTGDLSSSCFILSIAVHTYLCVVRQRKPAQWTVYAAIAFVWLFVYGVTVSGIIATMNGRGAGGYYVRASAWCWINVEYENLRLLNHYLFIFISIAATSILYTLIFFHLTSRRRRDNRTVSDKSYSPSAQPNRVSSTRRTHRHTARTDTSASSLEIRPTLATAANEDYKTPILPLKTLQADSKPDLDDEISVEDDSSSASSADSGFPRAFLIYPIIYAVCTLPLAAGRIATMAGADVPLWYFCLAGALITSNGWLDVLLWGLTRHTLIFGAPGDRYAGFTDQRVGLDTFAFMRTPRDRMFGNMVWVQGAAAGGNSNQNLPLRPPPTAQSVLGDGNADAQSVMTNRGFFARMGLGAQRLDDGESGRQRRFPTALAKTTSQESLRRAATSPASERALDMAIHLDMVTSVVVEVDHDSTARVDRRQRGLSPRNDPLANEGRAA